MQLTQSTLTTLYSKGNVQTYGTDLCCRNAEKKTHHGEFIQLRKGQITGFFLARSPRQGAEDEPTNATMAEQS
jgi:hypothetical protein